MSEDIVNGAESQDEVEVEDISAGRTVEKPFRPSDIRLTTPPMNLGDLLDMIEAGWNRKMKWR